MKILIYKKKIVVIQNSQGLKNQDKELFISLLNKTQLTIPLLTEEKYLETEIKNNKDFVSKRAEILSMIWNMEEEIMGKEI